MNNQSAGFAGIQIVKEKVEGGLDEKADQEILFNKIADKQVTDEPFDVYAYASSDLLIDYTIISGPATIAGNTITLDGSTGIVTVRASQAGNDFYNPAETMQSFIVTDDSKTDQTITFASIPDKITTDADFELSATATSGLTVSFQVLEGPAVIDGDTVSLLGGTGEVIIKASQEGDATYNPAPEIMKRFTVSGETQPGISLSLPLR